MITDALGNEVIVGKWYGYSRNGDGITKIVVGKIKSFKPDAKRVYLLDAIEKRHLYGGAAEFEDKDGGVSISPISLFPISDNDMIFMILKK